MELKYKNWDDITVARYRELAKIGGGFSDDEVIDASLDTLAFLCGVTREDIEQLRRDEFTRLMQEAQWLKVIEEEVIDEDIIINGKSYDLITDMSEFIVTQYIDWNTLIVDPVANLSRLLACILIPHGKSYGKGYNVEDVVKDIEERMPFIKAYSVLRFFAEAQRASFADTLRLLLKVAKLMILKTRDKSMIEKLKIEKRRLLNLLRYHG